METDSPARIPFELRLFGPFEVWVNGQRARRPRSHAGESLLALLALRQEYLVERTWLAALLWPDSGHEQALFNLRRNLTDVRQLLGVAASRLVAPTPRTLHLNLEGARCDVKEFDALVRRDDGDALRTIIALYRGPLLESCGDDWAGLERAAREQPYLAALETLAAKTLREGNPAEAIPYLKQVLAVDPYRETALRSLLRAMDASGDFSGAILAFREFRLLLRRELRTEPDPETQAVYQHLRRFAKDRPLLTPPPPLSLTTAERRAALSPSLPQPVSRLVGREEEIRQVRECLNQSRLVTLTGSGGAGKTRLAIAVAGEMAGDFPDGVRFADLSPFSEGAMVPLAITRSLHLPEESGRSPHEALIRHLAPKEILIVLDNCEHLLESCVSLTSALLQACPGLHFLLTSRQALGISGEIVWRVPSLTFPGDEELSEGKEKKLLEKLPQFDALRLFAERARESSPSFALSPKNIALIARICRRLDGIPLAIELAAARVRSLPVEEIEIRLGTNYRLLKGGAGLLPRHETLAAAFAWSWNLLAPSERVLLERLSTFAGGWSLAAAEAVCSGDGIETEDVMDSLLSLVDKSLVVYLPAAEGGSPSEARYRFLETTRQFAAERLVESGAAEIAHDSHRDYFLAWAEATKPKLWEEKQAFWFGRLETEHSNLRAALDWCRQQGDIEKEFRLVIALSRFWDTYGHLSEGRARLEAALRGRTDALPVTLYVDALVNAGWVANVQGDHAASCAHYEEALTLSRKIGYEFHLPALFNFLGCAYDDAGDIDRALSFFDQACIVCRRMGKLGFLAAALNNRGGALLRQGDGEAAQIPLTEGAALCRERGDHQLLGVTRMNLALVALRQRNYSEALACGASALRLLDAVHALINIPAALSLMAVCVQAVSQWERAARLLGAANQLREELGLPPEDVWMPELREVKAATRNALGADAFDALFAEGATMDREQAVANALEAEILSE